MNFIGTNGNDTLSDAGLPPSDDEFLGLAGDDLIISTNGDDGIYGEAGFDVASFAGRSAAVAVSLATGEESVSGSALTGIEGVIGTEFADTLIGGDGNDWLDVGASGTSLAADSVVGGAGFDTIGFGNAGAGVVVDMVSGMELNSFTTFSGIEAVSGSNYDDEITGDAGANWLNGEAGNDLLDGGAGNDILVGGTGSDTLIGGEGHDIAAFANLAGAVRVDLAAGTAEAWAPGADPSVDAPLPTETDYLSGIEGVIGTEFADTLIGGTGSDWLDVGASGPEPAADSVAGGAGYDTISFAHAGAGVVVDMVSGMELNSFTTFSGIEAVAGGGFDDEITGDAGVNWLSGGGGNDLLDGGAGADTLVGGTGSDTLIGGAGPDMAGFADLAGPVRVDLAAGTAEAWAPGADPSVDAPLAGETDYLSSIEGVIGTAHADTLIGGAGDDWLDVGESGGTPPADSVVGGAGFDTISFAHAGAGVSVEMAQGHESNSLTAFQGIEAAVGSAFDDDLFGDDGANWLSGGAGGDLLDGEAGSDTLIGGAGSDTLFGGDGFDVASFVDLAGPVRLDLVAGTAEVWAPGADPSVDAPLPGEADFLSGIEGIIGTIFADTLIGGTGSDWLDVGQSGNDLAADSVIGGEGFDTIGFAYAGTGVSVSMESGIEAHSLTSFSGIEGVYGSGFDDEITGDAGANWLNGSAGNDMLEGGAGDDSLLGGAGSDTLIGGEGFDQAIYAETAGPVRVDLAAGTADLWAPGADPSVDAPLAGETDYLSGIEGVVGTGFADTLLGGAGDDWLRGMDGDDHLSGGAGNDELIGGLGANTLVGGDGFDLANYYDAVSAVTVDLSSGTATGTGISDTLTGIEAARGSAFDDLIAGDVEGNLLEGAAGNDTIFGANGADTLNGGAGADMLAGGIDADLFRFVAGEANGDQILDFSAAEGDRLEFAGYGQAAGGASFTDIGGGFWQISGEGGAVVDLIYLGPGMSVDPSHWTFV